MVLFCVEINQCVGCTRQFFTKTFLGDDAAVLVRSSGEEPASPRAIEQASRTRRKILISTQRVTRRIAVIAICQCQVQSEMMTAPSAASASIVHGFRLFSSVAGV